jgi:hypothetical protein
MPVKTKLSLGWLLGLQFGDDQFGGLLGEGTAIRSVVRWAIVENAHALVGSKVDDGLAGRQAVRRKADLPDPGG